MTEYSYHDWFRRTTGQWTSERRYLFNMKTKDPVNLTTKFSIGALTEGDWDFQVIWTGQTEGVMNLKLLGNELHRDIGYFTSEPTISRLELIDRDTLVMSTSYDGKHFREEIRMLNEDSIRLRQTVGYDDLTGEPVIVGQYFEERTL